ncbi:hypothetical protein G5I_01701 [Acromyrmex echinatior]|uniref:Uncharacterized protein n=1 Tax=Acromyrmex echinatior TaxID=103372 RepID=F4W8C0_ACREC|nr:hypothetical protein G5I_01701 [Acromyrmex echinatior]
MAVEVGSRNGELENGLKQRESRGRGTIGWVVERRMVEDGFSIPPSGKPHLAGDTHAKQEDGVLYRVYTSTRKHEGERARERKGSSSDEDKQRAGVADGGCTRLHECSQQCAEEERLHTREFTECVLQEDWRCVREKEELEVRHGRRAFTVRTYVLLLLRTTHADERREGVLEVGAPTRERERAV